MNGPSARGFTLLEVLITLLLTGFTMVTVYQLYLSAQKTVLAQEEVVELQQNLRIAMERLTRDLRMAGFLVFTRYPPLQTAPHNPDADNPLILHTASPSGDSARLAAPVRVQSSQMTFSLTSPAMVELFAVDDKVRLFRPVDQSQPLDKYFRVVSRQPMDSSITLDGFDPTSNISYQVGDLLVPAASYPGTITYYLKDAELFSRHSDGHTQRITAKNEVGGTLVNGLTVFELAYVTDDGTVLHTVPTADLEVIRTVQVTLTGQVQNSKGTKLRSLRKVIALRNR